MSSLRDHWLEYVFVLPFVGFLAIFEFYPLLNMGFKALHDQTTGELSLQLYTNVLLDPQYRIAIRNSLLFSAGCSLIGGIGGTFVGFMANRLKSREKSLLLSLYSLPLTLSGLVVAFAFIVLLGRSGVLNLLMQRIFNLPRDVYFDIKSWIGLAFVYAFFMIPLMMQTMTAVFENLDRTLVEAARSLGAKPIQVWRHVIIPVLAPGFLAGISIQFAGMMGAYGTVVALVGGSKNLLSVQIWNHTSEGTFNLSQAGALAVWLVLLTTISLLCLNWIGRSLRPRGIDGN
jgi:putative spermidine/putrescine transport system permease protein